MSHGGRSFHKKDWLKLGLGVAAATTGAGALGYGPLASLFGGGLLGPAAAAAAELPLAGGLGAGAAGEMLATSSGIGAAGAAANPFSIFAGNVATNPGGYIKPALRGLNAARTAGLLGQQTSAGPPPMMNMARPMPGVPPVNTVVNSGAGGGNLGMKDMLMAQLATMDPSDPRRWQILQMLQQGATS